MNNQEAIDLLDKEKVPMVLNGENNEQLVIAHIKAIEALEKQIPMKPIIQKWNGINGVPYHLCPNCDGLVWGSRLDNKYKHCKDCGQAIDWSQDEN